MEWLKISILAVIQGITEFLPISSSGHLVLCKHFIGLEATSEFNSGNCIACWNITFHFNFL